MRHCLKGMWSPEKMLVRQQGKGERFFFFNVFRGNVSEKKMERLFKKKKYFLKVALKGSGRTTSIPSVDKGFGQH